MSHSGALIRKKNDIIVKDSLDCRQSFQLENALNGFLSL